MRLTNRMANIAQQTFPQGINGKPMQSTAPAIAPQPAGPGQSPVAGNGNPQGGGMMAPPPMGGGFLGKIGGMLGKPGAPMPATKGGMSGGIVHGAMGMGGADIPAGLLEALKNGMGGGGGAPLQPGGLLGGASMGGTGDASAPGAQAPAGQGGALAGLLGKLGGGIGGGLKKGVMGVSQLMGQR